MLAGAGYAFARAQQQAPEHLVLEVVGGLLAGNLGARLPDLFDPPLHPGHRSLAHGVVPVVAAGRVAVGSLDRWQAQFRAEAGSRAGLRATATTELERSWHALVELLFRVGAGALAGVLAGYGSHIALDAFTPASLPLLA
jgi:uncharacterized membrane protein YfcA